VSANTNADQSFSVRIAPWWDDSGASVRPDYPRTIGQARQWSNTTWDTIPEPIFAAVPRIRDGQPVTEYVKIPGHARQVRSDNPDITLGVTGTKFATSNAAPFELATFILASANGRLSEDDLRDLTITEDLAIYEDLGVKLETAGFLGDGETIWVCGKLDDAIVLPGDFSPTESYVVSTLAHDGSGSLKAFETYVRAVCRNTIKAGEMDAEKRGTAITIKNTTNWRDRLEQAKKVVLSTRTNRERLAEIYAELDAVTIDDEVVEDFLVTLVPGAEDPKISTRSKNNILRDRGTIRTMLHSQTTAPVADKALGLWLAAGEFFDHGRKYRSTDSYVKRTLIQPQEGKTIALDIISELTGAKVGKNTPEKTIVTV
jgi:phage/plasmid-like protein (TIGR03299 family)